MFTGLIETTGTVVSITSGAGATRMIISAPALRNCWHIGDSIAVNGVCLTAIPLPESAHFAADLAAETLTRTNLSDLSSGATVNLELPTPAGSPLGGHVVQGHVDATGSLVSLLPLHSDLATTDWRLTLEIPDHLASQVISQGSITINGISLTVARLDLPRIEIAIIPHTYRATNLHTLRPGERVNIETDALAKYAAAQRAASQQNWLTSAYLIANGY